MFCFSKALTKNSRFSKPYMKDEYRKAKLTAKLSWRICMLFFSMSLLKSLKSTRLALLFGSSCSIDLKFDYSSFKNLRYLLRYCCWSTLVSASSVMFCRDVIGFEEKVRLGWFIIMWGDTWQSNAILNLGSKLSCLVNYLRAITPKNPILLTRRACDKPSDE